MSHIQSIPYPLLPYFAARDKSIIAETAQIALEQLPIVNQKTAEQRKSLFLALKNDYENINSLHKNAINKAVLGNLDLLQESHVYTVVTAHQPNLFLGPLYFIYKILSAVRMAEDLNKIHPDKHFVPVYWMGSEDHDLEELNWTSAYNRKWTWETPQTGAVGRMKTEDLQPLLAEFMTAMGDSDNANTLKNVLQTAYNGENTIATATFILVNFLFGKYGLIIINQDSKALKTLFAPIMQDELLERKTEKLVLDDIADLEKQGFKGQAMPRNINLFYHTADFNRSRIVFEQENESKNGVYSVLNSDLRFSTHEIISELAEFPERFSPNVVLRPVFQEYILPNIAYIGGGGELAYWQERKRVFDYFKLPFPSLIRRQSLAIINTATQRKMEKTGMTNDDIWLDYESLAKNYINKNAANELDLATEKSELNAVFERILAKAMQTDNSLEKSVLGEQQKIINGIEQLEQKIIRAEKRKHETALQQIQAVLDKIFPNKNLQERYDNFIPYYVQYGENWFDDLKNAMQPPFANFILIVE